MHHLVNYSQIMSPVPLCLEKWGVMTPQLLWERRPCKGVVSGGVDLRLRHITSSPSQTLRRRLVRTTNDGRRRECLARHRPSRLYFSHFAARTVYNTVDLSVCGVCSDIRSESRFFLPTPPAFNAPVRGVSVGISPSRLARKH